MKRKTKPAADRTAERDAILESIDKALSVATAALQGSIDRGERIRKEIRSAAGALLQLVDVLDEKLSPAETSC